MIPPRKVIVFEKNYYLASLYQTDSMPLHQSDKVRKARRNKHYRYVFTIFSDSPFDVWTPTVREYFRRLFHNDKWCMQWEKGGDTDKDHIQGCIAFSNQRSFAQIQHILNSIPEAKPCHLEACKGWKSAVKYCSKHDTRVSGPWVNNVPFDMLTPPDVRELDPFRTLEPYPWQQTVINTLNGVVHPRHIYWFWEPTGRVGKTYLAKHICCTRNALYVGGKGKDILYAVATAYRERGRIECIVFDFPRSAGEFLSYGAIEAVKNGIFFSGKYESNTTIMPITHVVCFSNDPPDRSKLSQDRWVIREIVDHRCTPIEEDNEAGGV
jgi:hypothetical protein